MLSDFTQGTDTSVIISTVLNPVESMFKTSFISNLNESSKHPFSVIVNRDKHNLSEFNVANEQSNITIIVARLIMAFIIQSSKGRAIKV